MWRTYSLFRQAIVSDRLLRGDRARWLFIWYLAFCIGVGAAWTQGSDVSVHLDVDAAPHRAAAAQGAVWLIWQGSGPPPQGVESPAHEQQSYQILQKNKEFHPHFLIVPVGSSIDFPNADPFFHNVFSLFEGKRFDLGLYEAGSHRSVRFDREGVSYIFCNIHPEMGAVIISLRTPYYAALGPDRTAIIHNVPDGEYLLKVWSEDATEESLQAVKRIVEVKSGKAESFALRATARRTNELSHKNKFGEDYPPQPTKSY